MEAMDRDAPSDSCCVCLDDTNDLFDTPPVKCQTSQDTTHCLEISINPTHSR
jgi:hypothetical protein